MTKVTPEMLDAACEVAAWRGDEWVTLQEAAFVHGARACREMLARFVENSPPTDLKVMAGSMRANWHPGWGFDLGRIDDEIPENPWHGPLLAVMQPSLEVSRG